MAKGASRDRAIRRGCGFILGSNFTVGLIASLIHRPLNLWQAVFVYGIWLALVILP